MRRRWILIGVVVGLVVAAEVLLPLTGWPDPLSYGWCNVGYIGILHSHGCLLGLWASLGGKVTPWRLVTAVVGVAALTWVFYETEYHYGVRDANWIFFTFLQVCLVSLVLWVARLLGVELNDTLAAEPTEAAVQQRPWIQFSIRSLLAWTAATALLLGTIPWLLKGPFGESIFLPWDFEIVVVLCPSLIIGTIAVWGALGTRWKTGRYVAIIATPAACSIVTWKIIDENLTVCSIFFCTQFAWILILLLLIRLAGYRLIWRRRVRL